MGTSVDRPALNYTLLSSLSGPSGASQTHQAIWGATTHRQISRMVVTKCRGHPQDQGVAVLWAIWASTKRKNQCPEQPLHAPSRREQHFHMAERIPIRHPQPSISVYECHAWHQCPHRSQHGDANTSTETMLNGVVDDASMDNNESDVNTSELIDKLGKTHIAPRARSEWCNSVRPITRSDWEGCKGRHPNHLDTYMYDYNLR